MAESQTPFGFIRVSEREYDELNPSRKNDDVTNAFRLYLCCGRNITGEQYRGWRRESQTPFGFICVVDSNGEQLPFWHLMSQTPFGFIYVLNSIERKHNIGLMSSHKIFSFTNAFRLYLCFGPNSIPAGKMMTFGSQTPFGFIGVLDSKTEYATKTASRLSHKRLSALSVFWTEFIMARTMKNPNIWQSQTPFGFIGVVDSDTNWIIYAWAPGSQTPFGFIGVLDSRTSR